MDAFADPAREHTLVPGIPIEVSEAEHFL